MTWEVLVLSVHVECRGDRFYSLSGASGTTVSAAEPRQGSHGPVSVLMQRWRAEARAEVSTQNQDLAGHLASSRMAREAPQMRSYLMSQGH